MKDEFDKFSALEKTLQKSMRCFVYDIEESTKEVNPPKVIIHVTGEEYAYNRFWFKEDDGGDYIRLPNDVLSALNKIPLFCQGEMATDENHKDDKQYFRISKTRYESLKLNSFNLSNSGTFVKVASGEQVLYNSSINGQTPSPLMINIAGMKRYKKVYELYKFNNKCFIERKVTFHTKVPLEFGTYKITEVLYSKECGNKSTHSGEQTAEIQKKLWNYDKDYNKVGYGAGIWMKNFKFAPIGKDKTGKLLEDGDYIEETCIAPDRKNKWSPDSGSASRAANVNELPCSTYKAYFYRGDAPADKSIKNPMNALQKLKKDIADKKHDLAEKAGGQPIVFEIARYTRTNNFNYFLNGGPIPPNDYQGQPAFYEINYVKPRFRVVLKEEDYQPNFKIGTKEENSVVIQIETNTKPKRRVISLDLYTSSNDLEGCQGILGVLKSNVYTKLAGGKDWTGFNDNLIKIIPELGKVYGKEKFEAIDVRTRVFLKADPLPDIPTSL